MSEHMRTFSLGQARISLINIGDIRLPLAGYMNIPEDDLNLRDDLRALREQTILPIHNILVQLPDTTVLIDAGDYTPARNHDVYGIEGYTPPPSLENQLADMLVYPHDIDHLIITHRHWDHFNAITHNMDGRYVIRFSNAAHYLGAADWEKAEAVMAENEDAIEHHTLGLLESSFYLTLVEDRLDLGGGVEIIPAPGETAGHQIVRIHSEGDTLYCLGDLYHHPCEFINPDWRVGWADPALTRASRQALIPNALAENALLIATHIPEVGRLRQQDAGIVWEGIEV